VPLVRLTAPAAPPLAFRLARWLNSRGLLSDQRMDALRNERGSADYRAAQGVMRDVMVRVVNETYDDELMALSTNPLPKRFVWGADDTAAPTEAGRVAAERVAAPFRAIPGSAHLLTGDLELAVREELLAVLAEIEEPA